jgi:hypothetical protein
LDLAHFFLTNSNSVVGQAACRGWRVCSKMTPAIISYLPTPSPYPVQCCGHWHHGRHCPPTTIRLNKRMADPPVPALRGGRLIGAGWVRVDGRPAVMKQLVPLNARIDIDRQAEQQQRQRWSPS